MKSSLLLILGTYEGFEVKGLYVMMMTSSYSDSVFLYLVNSRHIETSIIIMSEVITTIMIIDNVTTIGIYWEMS